MSPFVETEEPLRSAGFQRRKAGRRMGKEVHAKSLHSHTGILVVVPKKSNCDPKQWVDRNRSSSLFFFSGERS